MTNLQASKKARALRRQANFAGLPGVVSHPSHLSGKRWRKKRRLRLEGDEENAGNIRNG